MPIKQTVELVKSLTPNAKTIGILYASSEDNSKSQVESFKKYSEKDGLNVVEYAVPSTNEINTTMSVMTGKVDAIWTPQDNTIASAFSTVISSANQAKIPVYTTVDTMVKEGAQVLAFGAGCGGSLGNYAYMQPFDLEKYVSLVDKGVKPFVYVI